MSCPICRKQTQPRYRPFCSRRCADVDLARWLRADYALPGPQDEGAESDHVNGANTPDDDRS